MLTAAHSARLPARALDDAEKARKRLGVGNACVRSRVYCVSAGFLLFLLFKQVQTC